jgi:hypothetical protein
MLEEHVVKTGILFCILSAWAGWALADAAPSAAETAAGRGDSLARAQCERQADSVAPAYVEFCSRFYNGTAPSYGY